MPVPPGITAAPGPRIGVAAALVSAALFGAMGILARFAYSAGADPLTVLWVRCTLAAGLLGATALASGAHFPRGRTLAALVLIGAFGFVGQSLAFFLALTLIPPGLVTLLLYLYPPLIVLWAAARRRRAPSVLQICALVLAFAGLAVTVQPFGSANARGVCLAVLTAFLYAAYVLAGDRAISKAGMLPGVTVVMCSAAAVYGVLVAVRGVHFPARPSGWLAIVTIGVLCTAGATLCLFAALRRIGPSRVSMLSFVEPVFALGLSAAVLGEAMKWPKIAGASLIVGALFLAARPAPADAPLRH